MNHSLVINGRAQNQVSRKNVFGKEYLSMRLSARKFCLHPRPSLQLYTSAYRAARITHIDPRNRQILCRQWSVEHFSTKEKKARPEK
jgi:hypothetical protein